MSSHQYKKMLIHLLLVYSPVLSKFGIYKIKVLKYYKISNSSVKK